MVNPFKDTNWNPDTAARRSFAKSLIIGFPIVAALFAASAWWKTHAVPGWPLWLAILGASAGVVFWVIPQIAKPFYLVWYFVACCIGIVVSNVLIAAFFYLVLTPVGLIMRVAGRDPMKRGLHRGSGSYWETPEKVVDRERYFRQF